MLNDRYLPIGLCAVAFFIWCFLLCYKYVHFGYNDWDLAFFTQACWQLLHCSQYTSVTGINYFGDHSYFITLLILPFFALAPHPLTLVLLKLMAYLVSAYLFYKIAYESLGQKTAVILMVLYLAFPANIFSVLYEFNPESLAPPILFWMFMAFQRRQWRAYLIASILLMLIKENMALIVCAYGLYGIFSKKCPPKIAWFNLFLGAGVFYSLVIYVVPYFRHLAYHPFVVRYEYLGQNIGEIIFNLFAQPHKALHAIFSGMNVKYFKSLFGPLLLPVLISWQFLFLASPILLQHMLSDNPSEHSIYYHYGSTITPFIFMAVMCALNLCFKRFSRRLFNAILFLLIFSVTAFLFCFLDAFVYKLNYHPDHLEAVRWDFVKAVPFQTGVIATFDYLTPLSSREYLYAFHKVYDESYQNPQEIKSNELNTGKSFVLPDQVRYALIDFKDPWLNRSLKLWPQASSKRIQMFFKRDNWKVIKRYGSIVLLKR
ncbi:MAG: DUF2079 domain-containing protein [Candidatus Omnitrophica bacterium]|nr:DUF2079 domain-containing protein [Candidatus Omnitrophota bacterium]